MREDELHTEDCIPGCVVLAQSHPWPWWAAVVARNPETGDWKDAKNRRWIFFFNDANGSWQYPRKMKRYTPFNTETILEINERFKRNNQVKDRIAGSLQLANEFLQGDSAPTQNLHRFNAKLTPESIAWENNMANGNGKLNGDQEFVDFGDVIEQNDLDDELNDDEEPHVVHCLPGNTTEEEDGNDDDDEMDEGGELDGNDNANQPVSTMEEETLDDSQMFDNSEQIDNENDNNSVNAEAEIVEEEEEESPKKTLKSPNTRYTVEVDDLDIEPTVPKNAGVSYADAVGMQGLTSVEQEQQNKSPTDVTKPEEEANGDVVEVANNPGVPKSNQAPNLDGAIPAVRNRSKRKRMKSTKLAGFVDPTISNRQRRTNRSKSKSKSSENASTPIVTPERTMPSSQETAGNQDTVEQVEDNAQDVQNDKQLNSAARSRSVNVFLKLAITRKGVREIHKMLGSADQDREMDDLDEEVAQVVASKRTIQTRSHLATATEASEKSLDEEQDEEMGGQTDELEPNNAITTERGKIKIKVKRKALKESVFQRVKAGKGKGKQVPGITRGGVSKRGGRGGARLPTRQTPPRKARAAAEAASAAAQATQAAYGKSRGKAKAVQSPVVTKKRKLIAARMPKRMVTVRDEDVATREQPPAVGQPQRKRPRTHLTSYRAPVQLEPVPERECEGEIQTESENDEDVDRLRRAFINPEDNRQVAELNIQLANRVSALEAHMKRVLERQDAEEPKKSAGASMAAVQLKTAAQMLQVAAQAFARENDYDPEQTARALESVWPDEEVRPKGFISQNVMVASKSIVWDEQTKGRYKKQARERMREQEAKEKVDAQKK